MLERPTFGFPVGLGRAAPVRGLSISNGGRNPVHVLPDLSVDGRLVLDAAADCAP